MSYRIVYLTEARQDMREIALYLSEYYFSTAQNFSAKLKEKVRALKEMPFMYPVYEDDPYFRKMVFERYALFYSVDEKRNLVIVHRIIHQKRDIGSEMLPHQIQE